MHDVRVYALYPEEKGLILVQVNIKTVFKNSFAVAMLGLSINTSEKCKVKYR